MKTEIWKGTIGSAVNILNRGGLVAVPTETVYGLAGNGLDAAAVEKIYEVKGRPAIKPISLMLPGPEAMERYAREVPAQAKYLAERFWPGPLTIILKAKDNIPRIVLAGGDTVGLRCPDHPLTLSLLKEAEIPLAVPSANPSGLPSPKDAETVENYFSGKIDAVIDGGRCEFGVESTIVSMADTPYRILRTGALTADSVADALVDKMTVIGITGQTGAGKTTALNVLRDAGALVIDCDRLYHSMLASDEKLVAALAQRFPDAVNKGVVDRKVLAGIVFSDPDELRSLNDITSGAIVSEVRNQLRQHAMNGGTVAAVDAVELIESGLSGYCNAVIAVTAPQEKRCERIMERDGISRAEAMKRINAQKTESYYEEYCDAVLLNDGTAECFAEQCKKTFEETIKNG